MKIVNGSISCRFDGGSYCFQNYFFNTLWNVKHIDNKSPFPITLDDKLVIHMKNNNLPMHVNIAMVYLLLKLGISGLMY